MAIITIVVVSIYTILRALFDPLAGLYMFKRFFLALFLALAYNNLIYMLPVILL